MNMSGVADGATSRPATPAPQAVALLRIDRTTLWKKLRQYGIEGE